VGLRVPDKGPHIDMTKTAIILHEIFASQKTGSAPLLCLTTGTRRLYSRLSWDTAYYSHTCFFATQKQPALR
jgi:hypothetical protein